MTVTLRPESSATPRVRPGGRLLSGLFLLVLVLVVVCLLSITMGSRDLTLGTVWAALFDPGADSPAQTVVREIRVPRTALGIVVGVALGLSGAILQGVTRNPLADPGIMGINAGAAATIVTAVMLLGVNGLGSYIWFAFLGAGLATVAVYMIASFGREGATPVKLALAGAAVTAGLTSVTSAIVMTNTEALDTLRRWQVGSLAGRYAPVFWQVLPFVVVGSLVALAAGRALNGLALGEDMARGLGQNVVRTRLLMFATVAVLCGAATAACGPITFVGLVVPHVARLLCGPDYRWILAYSTVLTPIVLLGADVIGRVVLGSGELQVGVVLGALGAPVFVLLVRARHLVEL